MVKKIKIYTEKQLSYKIYMTKKNLKMLSYLLIGLGVLFLFYGLSVPAFMAGQYLILSLILLGSGGYLFIKNKKK